MGKDVGDKEREDLAPQKGPQITLPIAPLETMSQNRTWLACLKSQVYVSSSISQVKEE